MLCRIFASLHLRSHVAAACHKVYKVIASFVQCSFLSINHTVTRPLKLMCQMQYSVVKFDIENFPGNCPHRLVDITSMFYLVIGGIDPHASIL